MKKGKSVFSKEDIIFVSQLIKSLQEASLKLEELYKNNDYENFNKLKKFILEVQKRISQNLE